MSGSRTPPLLSSRNWVADAKYLYPQCKLSQYLPARYVLSFLIFCAMSLEFAHRVCLSVTIVVMVNQTAVTQLKKNFTPQDTCSTGDKVTNEEVIDTGSFIWSPSIQGVVLGSYFYGFMCTQFCGGRLAEIFGGKWLLGMSIFLGSLLTIVTPFAADIGPVMLVILRIMMGLMHGICLPVAYSMLSIWAAEGERNTLMALCVVGDNVGTVLSMPLAGYLCGHGFAGGWPSVFYVLGALGILWFVFWCCLAHSVPDDHPRISQTELDYIQKGKTYGHMHQKLPVPWKKIITSKPVWSIAIATFASSWGHKTLLTKLPTYLEIVLHIPIQKNGTMNSLIYVCTCVTLFCSGFASDYLKTKKKLSPTKVRKSFQLLATLGPAICLCLITYARCDKIAVIAFLSAAMAFHGLHGGGHLSMASDMAPHHTGSVYGLATGMGSTAGIFCPLVAGLILDSGHHIITQWNLVFYLSAALYIFAGLIFTLWASADLQPWATTQPLLKDALCAEEAYIVNYTEDLESSYKYGAIS